jgi:hypothetical protein
MLFNVRIVFFHVPTSIKKFRKSTRILTVVNNYLSKMCNFFTILFYLVHVWAYTCLRLLDHMFFKLFFVDNNRMNVKIFVFWSRKNTPRGILL